MKTAIIISIDEALAKRIREQARVSMVPISRLVCRAIENELENPSKLPLPKGPSRRAKR